VSTVSERRQRLAALLQRECSRRRLSLRAAGLQIGISAATLSRVAGGELDASLESFEAILRWAGASADELLGLQPAEPGSLDHLRRLLAEMGLDAEAAEAILHLVDLLSRSPCTPPAARR
jgi:transcriptional regulator with XRE-family HTH domain